MEVSSADKYEGAFKEAVKARSSALVVAQDALAGSNLKLIADLAIKHRLPASYPRGEFVDNGGLMSYGPDPDESLKACRVDDRQNSKRSQARRPACGAADKVRAGY